MAKKVSVINMKGGSGKTTVAVQLAHHFSRSSREGVLLVDLDPQFNATQHVLQQWQYEAILDGNKPTIWNVFEQFTLTPGSPRPEAVAPADVIHEVRDGLHLIPSRLELAYSLQNPGQKEQMLARLVKAVEADYQLIIMDCAPTESLLTTAAYLASDYILVPVRPEYLCTIGLPLLGRSMKRFKMRYEEHPLKVAGIAFNAIEKYSPEEDRAKADVRRIAEEEGWYVFENELRYSRSYTTSARKGQPLSQTPWVHWETATNFSAFADEFSGRIGL